MANTLNTIAPANLIAQRILDTLIATYPFFSSIGADFSSEEVPMGTTINVHQPNALTAGDYSTTTGYTPQDVSQTERPLVVNKFKHATYFFNDQERSSSSISLIERFAEAGAYAIGSAMVTDLFALVTSGNYTNGTLVAVGSFARSSVTALGKTLTGRKVSPIGRKLIVNSDYFEKLQNDTVLVANAGSPADTVRSGVVGNVNGFSTYEYAQLPTTGNLAGIGFTPNAFLLAARLPAKPEKTDSGVQFNVVTHQDTGLSLMVRTWYDPLLGREYRSYSLLYGVAVGDPAQLQRITSA